MPLRRLSEAFPPGQCNNLVDCFAYVLDFGMRSGGGLADYLEGGGNGDVIGPQTMGFARLVRCDFIGVLFSRFLKPHWLRFQCIV